VFISNHKIGQDTDFFYLEGNSVTDMRLAAAVRQESEKLSVEEIFEDPILANQAKLIICKI